MKPDKEQRGLGDPILLEKIDKLFACNVGEYISLPQIVVVGDQSSGKSSILAGLMRLPFARDSGLCTRFATQIIFRRSVEEKIIISIIPNMDASHEHADKIKAWSVTEVKTLDSGSFVRIMNEASAAMGLSDWRDATEASQSLFSNDILRIEISGRDEQHLSVIDVPGIFKNTTEGLTTKADITLVRNMVQGYMDNPRSVMLTVVPANVDVATQEILEMAHDVDPDGQRTLGVLTKPDLVDEGSEQRVIDMLDSRTQILRLGWHMVRNLGQKQLTDNSVDPQQVEKDFFRLEKPWCNVEKSKVGIEALRTRIEGVLAAQIRRDFPKVKKEVGKRLKSAQNDLQKLGIERGTPESQKVFLLDFATRFQRHVSFALDARYGSSDIFDDNLSLRLATAVTMRNAHFASEVDCWGQEYQFDSTAQAEELDPDLGEKEKANEEKTPQHTASTALKTRKFPDSPDLVEILHEAENLTACSLEGIMHWLKDVYQTSRGFELGTFDSSILATTMKKQSVKWTGLALGYASDVVVITHAFITNLIALTCADEHVSRELLSILMDGLLERYTIALDQVRFLLHVERTGTPMTLNHYFNENLQKCRQKRMKADAEEKSFHVPAHGMVVKVDNLATNHPMSNVEHVVQDIHDILSSYYKVARKRFVDNVCMQAIDHFLINGPKTPLMLFSPAFVNGLDVDQLESIAGEDMLTKRKRQQLNKEIQNLEAGRKILT